MQKPSNLTDVQKRRLSVLEPLLRNAVKLGNFERAKLITVDIQEMLRPTGHETRLMQAKNWLFEAALEAGDVEYAISGFQGIRKKVSRSTRLHLEATALLAVCFLRKGDLKAASPLVDAALHDLKNISSEQKRRKLKTNLVKRFEEEGMIAALASNSNYTSKPFDIVQIQSEAITISQTKTKDEIIVLLGQSTPPYVLDFLKKVSEESRKKLPYKEILLLANPVVDEKNLKVGKKVFNSLKRVIWKSLCDPESDVYKMWFSDGVKVVLDKKYITGAIVAAISGLRIGVYALAVYFTALVIKTGLDVFCDAYKPPPIMEARSK